MGGGEFEFCFVMTIGYRESFPRRHKRAGEAIPTHFEQKILDGTKRHTLRKFARDRYKRWATASYIHHSVRTRTTEVRMFRVQKNPKNLQTVRLEMTEAGKIDIYITGAILGNGHQLNDEQRAIFIANDGFDSEQDFVEWFEWDVKRGENEYLLIHFYPNYRY